MNRIAPYIVIVLLLALFATWGLYENASDEAARANAEVASLKHTRDTERAQQKGVNDALRKQIDDLVGINAGLADDLERLRERAGRVSDTPRTACAGATGAELSGPDAGFLVREAARADRLRSALSACYQYVDTVSAK